MRRLILCLLSATTASCNPSTEPPEVRAVTVDSIPVLDIFDPGLGDEPVFELPVGGTRFANGNVLVADYYGTAVILFDSAGRVIKRAGVRGNGPGEYGVLQWLGRCNDHVAFVIDPTKVRVDGYDAEGNVVRSFEGEPASAWIGCHRSGRAAYWQAEALARMPSPNDPPLRGQLLLGDFGGRLKPAGEFEVGLLGPMRRLTQVALGRSSFFVGKAENGLVDVFDYKGKPVGSIDTGAEPQRVTTENYEAALDQYVAYLMARAEHEPMKQLYRDRFPKPDRAPSFNDLVIDSEDVLWVVVSLPGSGKTTLKAFSTSGAALGESNLAQELTVYEIGRDYVLGSYQDAEGVPHVAMYRARRHQ